MNILYNIHVYTNLFHILYNNLKKTWDQCHFYETYQTQQRKGSWRYNVKQSILDTIWGGEMWCKLYWAFDTSFPSKWNKEENGKRMKHKKSKTIQNLHHGSVAMTSSFLNWQIMILRNTSRLTMASTTSNTISSFTLSLSLDRATQFIFSGQGSNPDCLIESPAN